MLQVKMISEGFYKAINVASKHECYIDQDMLGDFRASWEIKGADGSFDSCESPAFNTIEEAARWIECQSVIISTNFDDAPLIAN